jgi:Thioesterase superfamily
MRLALDSACGYAALTLMPEDAEVLTVELKVNLLAPASGDRVVAQGEVIRAGRTRPSAAARRTPSRGPSARTWRPCSRRWCVGARAERGFSSMRSSTARLGQAGDDGKDVGDCSQSRQQAMEPL